jgi:hypothetical protein
VGLAVVGFLVVLALEHWAARHASGSASTASV